MIDSIDMSLVDWSRGQFALTAMYHWLFVPLTLGLSFIIAIMETFYVRTGNPEWKKITKFWMVLFGINFAIGVATGIILEFEFGTNWSNYSWFVGDIFGAPLAVEGIMAFFMESTFIAVMFFGWNKVSKKFHLISTWLVAAGANLSALWILVANAWMQMPVGMEFNPDTARNEMVNFWEVLFSPMAINKFLHTVSSGLILAAIFVAGISSWYLLRKREIQFAKKSIAVASVFGIIAALYNIYTGDSSARLLAKEQPMKFAALEGMYEGEESAGLVVFGLLNTSENSANPYNINEYLVKVEIPKFLSFMTFGDFNAYVPGMKDLLEGNDQKNIMPASEKIERGRTARALLIDLKKAKENNETEKYNELRDQFMSADFKENYFRYFGYGYFNDLSDLVPNVPITFYSFHLMVGLGFLFLIIMVLLLFASFNDLLQKWRWLLVITLFSIPLPYIASQAGWIVAEVGRQPWIIQDLMPTMAAVSNIDASSVQITFWLFAFIFSSLLIAEIAIMVKQIKIGPKEGGNKHV